MLVCEVVSRAGNHCRHGRLRPWDKLQAGIGDNREIVTDLASGTRQGSSSLQL
jgi:hypothetical protein